MCMFLEPSVAPLRPCSPRRRHCSQPIPQSVEICGRGAACIIRSTRGMKRARIERQQSSVLARIERQQSSVLAEQQTGAGVVISSTFSRALHEILTRPRVVQTVLGFLAASDLAKTARTSRAFANAQQALWRHIGLLCFTRAPFAVIQRALGRVGQHLQELRLYHCQLPPGFDLLEQLGTPPGLRSITLHGCFGLSLPTQSLRAFCARRFEMATASPDPLVPLEFRTWHWSAAKFVHAVRGWPVSQRGFRVTLCPLHLPARAVGDDPPPTWLSAVAAGSAGSDQSCSCTLSNGCAAGSGQQPCDQQAIRDPRKFSELRAELTVPPCSHCLAWWCLDHCSSSGMIWDTCRLCLGALCGSCVRQCASAGCGQSLCPACAFRDPEDGQVYCSKPTRCGGRGGSTSSSGCGRPTCRPQLRACESNPDHAICPSCAADRRCQDCQGYLCPEPACSRRVPGRCTLCVKRVVCTPCHESLVRRQFCLCAFCATPVRTKTSQGTRA